MVNYAHLLRIYTEISLYRNINLQLNDILNTLANSRPSIPAAIAHAPTSQVETTSLTIPKCPDPYDADDYPDVCWHENDWILHGEKQRNGGNTVSKLDFLTDHDGRTLSEKRMKVNTDSARQAWTQLYYHRLDPTSWKKKAEDAKQYFNAVMKAEFPEFRYCEGDWKIERFATIKYPDWCRHTRDKGGLNRALQNSFIH